MLMLAIFILAGIGAIAGIIAIDNKLSAINFQELMKWETWTKSRITRILIYISVIILVAFVTFSENYNKHDDNLKDDAEYSSDETEVSMPEILEIIEFPNQIELYNSEDIFVKISDNTIGELKVKLVFANNRGQYSIEYNDDIDLQLIDGYWKILYYFGEFGERRYQIWITDGKTKHLKSQEYYTLVKRESDVESDELYSKTISFSERSEASFNEVKTFIGLIDYNVTGDYSGHEINIKLPNKEGYEKVIRLPYSEVFVYDNKEYRLKLEDGIGASLKATITEIKEQ